MPKKIQLKKQIHLDKDKTKTAVYLAVASFLFIFGVVSSKALLGLYAYQNRVISAQKTTLSNINTDQQTANGIVSEYENFVNTQTNILGGPKVGTTANSGDNAKVILDALPQTYDFPALLSSMQVLLNIPGITIDSLSGTDVGSSASQQTATPTLMPISFSISGSYISIENALLAIQHSIRPIKIDTLAFSGSDSNLTMTITADTYYYDPPSGLVTTTETIQ
ncbi:MAG TPA: type 4a pilus biogenesis protein PilO [Candidatus Saccharimonadia bacterium]|nr:type 4a pilus biogenesis protein PilO [Candidatus Saccharimonadia bacterium]